MALRIKHQHIRGFGLENEKVQWPAGPTAGFETSNGLAEACGSLGLGPENPLSAPQTKGPTCICKNMQL